MFAEIAEKMTIQVTKTNKCSNESKCVNCGEDTWQGVMTVT